MLVILIQTEGGDLNFVLPHDLFLDDCPRFGDFVNRPGFLFLFCLRILVLTLPTSHHLHDCFASFRDKKLTKSLLNIALD